MGESFHVPKKPSCPYRPGGVVEKIIRLIDDRLTERMARRPRLERIASITAQLETIKRTCPTSWTAARRILYPC